MGKKNVIKQNKKTVVQPETVDTGVQQGAVDEVAQGTTNSAENSEEKLQVPAGTDNGAEKNGEGNPGVDTENQNKADGKEGSDNENCVTKPSDSVKEENTEDVVEIIVVPDVAKPERTPKRKIIQKTRGEIATDVFTKNSRCKTLYFTSDSIPFFEKTYALAHSARLKDTTIVTVNRGE